jgi:hypothetical protein
MSVLEVINEDEHFDSEWVIETVWALIGWDLVA